MRIRAVIVVGLLTTRLAVADESGPYAALVKGQPAPVAALIERIVDCNHWQGEEPYDPAREEEIERAISELRCSSLVADESNILQQYGADPEAKKAIESAKDTVW